MSDREIREKIQDAISRSNYFDEIYESELNSAIESKVDEIDFSDYQDDIRAIIDDYLDISDMVCDEVREATREKLDCC